MSKTPGHKPAPDPVLTAAKTLESLANILDGGGVAPDKIKGLAVCLRPIATLLRATRTDVPFAAKVTGNWLATLDAISRDRVLRALIDRQLIEDISPYEDTIDELTDALDHLETHRPGRKKEAGRVPWLASVAARKELRGWTWSEAYESTSGEEQSNVGNAESLRNAVQTAKREDAEEFSKELAEQKRKLAHDAGEH